MRQLKWSGWAAYVALCLVVYPTLPARIPIHFGLSGLADRWTDKSPLAWLMLPGILALMFFMTDLTAQATVKHPSLLNIPQKERFLALTEAQRAPIYEELKKLLDMVGIFMLLLFAAIQFMMYVVAVSGSQFPGYFAILTIVFTVSLLAYVAAFNTRVKRLINEAGNHGSIGRTS